MKTQVYEPELVEFYENLAVLEGNIATSQVHGVEIMFDKVKLGEILRIPSMGLAEYIWK